MVCQPLDNLTWRSCVTVCECCFLFLLLVRPLVVVWNGGYVKLFFFFLHNYAREETTSRNKLEETVFFPNKTLPSQCFTISPFFFSNKFLPFHGFPHLFFSNIFMLSRKHFDSTFLYLSQSCYTNSRFLKT